MIIKNPMRNNQHVWTTCFIQINTTIDIYVDSRGPGNSMQYTQHIRFTYTISSRRMAFGHMAAGWSAAAYMAGQSLSFQDLSGVHASSSLVAPW